MPHNPDSINHFGDMPPEEFHQHAESVIAWIRDYLARVSSPNLEQVPRVLPATEPGDVRKHIPQSPPMLGESVADILRDFENVIVPNTTLWNNPNFFAYFSITASSIGILAEFLIAALNNNSMVWKSGQAATELERTVLGWLAEAMGLPRDLWGMIFDTASLSTMQAIACAREEAGIEARERGLAGRGAEVPRMRVYASELVHSSIDKACITLGLGAENVVKIPVNERLQMQPKALEAAITRDRAAGYMPICVVGVVGTTSAGSSDDITALASICEREKIWLHVDAAWAGPAAMLEEWRDRFQGWERADSIVVNPHKWLFVPIDLSVLYCRKPNVLKQAFSLTPEYLKTTEDDVVENMMDYGIQLGRRFRSLKLWFVMRYFGVEGIKSRLREHIALAQLFAELVKQHPDFELTTPVEFALVCFRYKPESHAGASETTLERLNAELEERINAEGAIFLVHTKLHDVYTLRFAIGNLHTSEAHVRRAFERITGVATHVQ
ncbi:MAG: pyridoxal-dependent decarboxylase [Candidatus Kapabacteria bacterium]|jgi:aromatic-L-amino-acid decarboxylase|nr:pyridoxal-dependent decarboxylase [Candidatus Kapabacteria bacterium]